ncbi:MAG: hypothetical protein CSA07_03690 [Bacteroidia bacterium]|nr:MAG: hypothetical protein CSA07_03690 [Bacteroidia bacterium]
MSKTGYEYALAATDTAILLRVRVRRYRFVEFSLPPDDLQQRMGDVLPTLERVEALLDEARVPFTLGAGDACPAWGEVQREEMQDYIYDGKVRSNRWSLLSPREAKRITRIIARGQRILGKRLPARMAGTGYEHSVYLSTRFWAWPKSYQAEADLYPATLHVALPQGKVLHLLFDYEHFADGLPHIVPTVELVKRTLEGARLDFKLLSTRSYEHRTLGWEEELGPRRVVVRLSRLKIFLTLVATLLFVAGGAWLATKGEFSAHSRFYGYPWLAKAIGGVAVLFFGPMGGYAGWKLFDRRPGLIVDSRGVSDYSNAASVGLIEWEDIVDIAPQAGRHPDFLLVFVRNPEKYLGRARSRMHTLFLRGNIWVNGTPLAISALTLRGTVWDLERIVKGGRERWG